MAPRAPAQALQQPLQGCELVEALDAAGRMLRQHRGRVFSGGQVDEEDMVHFLRMVHCLRYSVEVPADCGWSIRAEVSEGAIARTSDSRLGPDGIPYGAWRPHADEVAILGAVTGIKGGRRG